MVPQSDHFSDALLEWFNTWGQQKISTKTKRIVAATTIGITIVLLAYSLLSMPFVGLPESFRERLSELALLLLAPGGIVQVFQPRARPPYFNEVSDLVFPIATAFWALVAYLFLIRQARRRAVRQGRKGSD